MSETLIRRFQYPSGEAPGLIETRAVELQVDYAHEVDAVADWCHAAADSNFNVIALNVFSNGATAYPSAAMQSHRLTGQSPGLWGTDPLEQVCAVARDRGLHVWAVLSVDAGSMRGLRTRARIALRRWLMASSGARAFCICNPEFRRLFGDLASEVTARYPIRGVVLHLPSTALDLCSCRSCARKAMDDKGLDTKAIVASGIPDQLQALREWQRTQVTSFCLSLKARARKSNPALFAALYTDVLAQSADLHPLHGALEDGIIQCVIAPTDSAGDSAPCNEEAAQLLSDVMLLPALSLADDHSPALDLRGHVHGFFEAGTRTVHQMPPKLPLFGQPAMPVEVDPIASAIHYFSEAALHASAEPVLAAAIQARIEALQVTAVSVDVTEALCAETELLIDSLERNPVPAAAEVVAELHRAKRMLLLASS